MGIICDKHSKSKIFFIIYVSMPRLLGFLRKLSHFLKNSEIAPHLHMLKGDLNLNHYHVFFR